MLQADICQRAVHARDARFDGIFFVGITTTRVYCRPVCPARVSYPDRRRFFETAASAERAGYRPCLRCRPELAPGRALMDAVPRLARLAAQRIARGRAQRPQRRRSGRGAGGERAASPARAGAPARRVAGGAGADPPPAPRQATARRDVAAGHADRVRQRLPEPAPVQLRVPRAIPAEPERPAARPRRARRRPPGRRATS